MRTPGIERSVEIAAPVDEVFAFHLDTRNAARIAPRGQRVVGVDGVFPVTAGGVVVMRMRHPPLPLTITWRVRIEIVEPPHRIVDVAERSPFAAWRHEHIFQPLGPGRTLMTDRVTYRLPGGPVGRVAGRLIVRPLLARAFAGRHRRTREVLEGRG
ncbi:SRPBCC family protein [Miltoncostaea marina]|uniref:SRPBCC family protein n=1 Tax=Miltoncostaea marina TaxID=2843215 RepID=UPI001C3E1542|nr:SRPBCC family protein [Miltoncostaea marina]